MIKGREYQPTWLIVSGSGRNVGKSMLMEQIIERHSPEHKLISLKISPHKHSGNKEQRPVAKGTGFRIFKEDHHSDKDSGRFLKAGANESFYLECEDQDLGAALQTFNTLIKKGHLILAESGRLGHIIKPGLMIFVKGQGHELSSGKRISFELSDLIIQSENEIISTSSKIDIRNRAWHLNS